LRFFFFFFFSLTPDKVLSIVAANISGYFLLVSYKVLEGTGSAISIAG